MNWYKNMLLEWADSQGSPKVERVLAVFAPEAEVVLIQIFDPKASPRSEQMDVLERAIAAHECRLLTADPFATLEPAEDSIPPKQRAQRDRALKAIAPVLELPGPDPFFGRERGTIIKRSAAELGLSKRLVYHYLRKFWQKGQHANALFPD